MKVYSIINQKGGVGKTTIAEVLTEGLKAEGLKVLAIDMDTQQNLSATVKADTNSRTIADVLHGECSINDAIQHTDLCDIIPAPAYMGELNTNIVYTLKTALESLKGYDYVIIDTPPALGYITTTALTSSNEVIIPAQADVYCIQGIYNLYETILAVRESTNSKLKIAGILLTKHSNRTILNRDLTESVKELAEHMGTKVFVTTIRESVTIREAQTLQRSIFEYSPKANITEDFKAFIRELRG